MIFFGPTFSPWNLFFEEAPKKPKEQLKLANDKPKEVKDNFATELAKITDKNTVKIIWDKQETWTEEMRKIYSTIKDECRAAADKGKKYFTYESTENVDFNSICQYLNNIDGLVLTKYHVSSSVAKENKEEPIQKKYMSVTFSW